MRRFLPILAITVCQLLAQTDRATLTGNVTDPAEKTITAARITIQSAATGSVYAATSNSAGVFVIGSLPVGQYTASIEAKGFQTLEFKPFTLRVGETRVFNAALSVATVGTTRTGDRGLRGSEPHVGGGGRLHSGRATERPANERAQL